MGDGSRWERDTASAHRDGNCEVVSTRAVCDVTVGWYPKEAGSDVELLLADDCLQDDVSALGYFSESAVKRFAGAIVVDEDQEVGTWEDGRP